MTMHKKMKESKKLTGKRKTSQDGKSEVIIFGAGIAGLRLGQKLCGQNKVTVIEKLDHVGGLAASFLHKDFIFDVGPHKIYSIIPGVMQQYKEILGKDCLVVDKKNSLYLMGNFYSFPIKPLQFARQFSPIVAAKCGLSYALTLIKKKPRSKIKTYEDYFINGFGKQAYDLIFKQVASKVWGDPKTLSADLAERRVPVPNIIRILKGLVMKSETPEVSASKFYYPKKGMGEISRRLADEVTANEGEIYVNSHPTKVLIKDRKVASVAFEDNDSKNQRHILAPSCVVSTIHLIDLLSIMEPMPPKDVIEAARKLKYRSLIIAFLIIEKPRALNDHWVFFPENKFIFTRVAEIKNFSKWTAPKDKTALTVEVACEYRGDIYNLTDDKLIERIKADLESCGIVSVKDISEHFMIRINRCYPVYDIDYKKNLGKVLDFIDSIDNLYTIGRQGLFNYNNTDHSMDMANKLAAHILSHSPKKEWRKTRQSFDEYRIID